MSKREASMHHSAYFINIHKRISYHSAYFIIHEHSKLHGRAVTAKEHVSVVQYTAMMIMAYAQRLRCKKNI